MSSSNTNFIGLLPSDLDSFRIGDWRVDPGSDEILKGRTTIRLEPKAMDTLVYLASHGGQVVSRDEIERHVWRGAIVGYDVVTSTVSKLRRALGDDITQPRFIATIPKRGYRLVASVSRAAAVARFDDAVADSAFSGSAPVGWRSALLRGAGVMVPAVAMIAGILAAVYLGAPSPLPETTGRVQMEQLSSAPSVRGLLFEHPSEDPQQTELAAGLTEGIIADLIGASDLLVIAGHTSFTLDGKAVTVREIAGAPRIDFVIEGTIRRGGPLPLVRAKLIDAQSGHR